MSRSKKILSLLQFALLLGIIIGIPAALYFCNPEIIENFKSIDKFNAWIADYKGIGLIIYLICQIAQIVICVLPGQVIQIAGGYLFGFVVTFFISIIGAVIGTVITFYLAKLLGRNASCSSAENSGSTNTSALCPHSAPEKSYFSSI